jgi:hypothetical protein
VVLDYLVLSQLGHISEEKAQKYGSPWAVQTATYDFHDSDVVAECTRCFFDTVRQYREGFALYGTKMSFEWEQIADDGHVIFTGIDDAERTGVPDTDHLLPEEIKPFTRREAITDPSLLSFKQGNEHGGSHPHVAHQFLMALVEDRQPEVDVYKSATITCAGLCAHLSSMNNAERTPIPQFGGE